MIRDAAGKIAERMEKSLSEQKTETEGPDGQTAGRALRQWTEKGRADMRKDKGQGVLLAALGILPVLVFSLLAAPHLKGGLSGMP